MSQPSPFGGDQRASTSSSRIGESSWTAPLTACIPGNRSHNAYMARRSGNDNVVVNADDRVSGSAPSFLSFFSSSRSGREDERQGLLSNESNVNDDDENPRRRHSRAAFDDSDAISMLSDIADRDGRFRGDGGAAAKRRRAARRQRSRQSGFLGMGDVASQLLACGLFGRPKKSIAAERWSHGAADGGDHRPHTLLAEREEDEGFEGEQEQERVHGHARTQSQDSQATSDAGSFVGIDRPPESGEEDAGSLGDDAIAKIGCESEGEADLEEATEHSNPSNGDGQKPGEAMPEHDTAKEREEEEAESAAKIAAQQAQEEADLAAAEEAAIAKARRKAERKAAKQGLAQLRSQGSHRSKWATEAEAEAAAGGFGFADFDEEQVPEFSHQDEAQWHSPHPVEDYNAYGEPYQGYDSQAMESYGELQHPQQPDGNYTPEVHHHYYYENEASTGNDGREQGLPSITTLPPLSPPSQAKEGETNTQTPVSDEDEDDADIAGLGLSSRTRRGSKQAGSGNGSNSSRRARRYKGGSQSSSGSQSRHSSSTGGNRYMMSSHRDPEQASSSSGTRDKYLSPNLGGAHPLSSSSGGTTATMSSSSASSSATKPSYRDRPRRHERTGSRSTNSSASGTRIVDGSATTRHRGAALVGGGSEVDRDRDSVASSRTLGMVDEISEEERQRRADAAAGGFDDFEMPAPATAFPQDNEEADKPSVAADPLSSPLREDGDMTIQPASPTKKKVSYRDKRNRAGNHIDRHPLSGEQGSHDVDREDEGNEAFAW